MMAKRNTNTVAMRLLAAVSLMALTLTGCSVMNGAPASTGSNRIENAEPHNLAVATAVESLQQQVWGGDWTPAVGGNLLMRCESGSDYRFYGSWFTADGYEAPVDPEATAQELSSWLSAAGWSDVEIESSESPDLWRVWATREDAEIAEAMVTWYPEGDVGAPDPHVVLDVDSVCSPTDEKA